MTNSCRFLSCSDTFRPVRRRQSSKPQRPSSKEIPILKFQKENARFFPLDIEVWGFPGIWSWNLELSSVSVAARLSRGKSADNEAAGRYSRGGVRRIGSGEKAGV